MNILIKKLGLRENCL